MSLQRFKIYRGFSYVVWALAINALGILTWKLTHAYCGDVGDAAFIMVMVLSGRTSLILVERLQERWDPSGELRSICADEARMNK